MDDSIIIKVYDKLFGESTYNFNVLTNPPIMSLQYHKYNILIREDWIGDDEEGDKAIIEVMEDVSGKSTSTEYYGWGLVLDFTVWDYWAWNEGDLFDFGHCVSLPFPWIGPDFFYRGLLWGKLMGSITKNVELEGSSTIGPLTVQKS